MFFFGVNPGRKLANETADLLGIQRSLFDTALLEHKITWASLKPLAKSGLSAAELASDVLVQLESGLDILLKKFGPQPEISSAQAQLSFYSISQFRLRDKANKNLNILLEILKKHERTLQDEVKLSAFHSMVNQLFQGMGVLEAIINSIIWAIPDDSILSSKIMAAEIATTQMEIDVVFKSLIGKQLAIDNGTKDGSMFIGRTLVGGLMGRRIALAWLSVVENAEKGI